MRKPLRIYDRRPIEPFIILTDGEEWRFLANPNAHDPETQWAWAVPGELLEAMLKEYVGIKARVKVE